MPLPRNLDAQLTDKDLRWLRSIKVGLQNEPEPMVSTEAYCSLRDANDFITRNNFTLRRQRDRLMKRLRSQAAVIGELKRMAMGAAAGAAIVLLVLWMRDLGIWPR